MMCAVSSVWMYLLVTEPFPVTDQSRDGHLCKAQIVGNSREDLSEDVRRRRSSRNAL
jgi:hypothetical protein